MNPAGVRSKVVGRGSPARLHRISLYALVAVHKALFCLLLLEVGLEGGFMPEAAETHAQKLSESVGPNCHRDDRPHSTGHTVVTRLPAPSFDVPKPPPSEPAKPLGDPRSRPSGPRPPPAFC
jgi:hypothetical protein